MTNKKFNEKFKKIVVELNRSGQLVKELSSDYGVSEVKVYKWIEKYSLITSVDEREYAALKISDIVNDDIQFDKLSKYNIQNNAKIDNNLILNNDVLLSIRGINRKISIFKSDRENVLMSQNFVGICCFQHF